MGKIRRKIEAFLLIKLKDGTFCYGRVLSEPLIAFYDYNSDVEILEPSEICSKPILFTINVMNDAVTSGRWKIIGYLPLEVALKSKPNFFTQTRGSKKFSIYKNGILTPASWNECKNLEAAAVWDPEHVEDRLYDYYAGIPNKWLESLKPIKQ